MVNGVVTASEGVVAVQEKRVSVDLKARRDHVVKTVNVCPVAAENSQTMKKKTSTRSKTSEPAMGTAATGDGETYEARLELKLPT
jgi:hypothetical protein